MLLLQQSKLSAISINPKEADLFISVPIWELSLFLGVVYVAPPHLSFLLLMVLVCSGTALRTLSPSSSSLIIINIPSRKAASEILLETLYQELNPDWNIKVRLSLSLSFLSPSNPIFPLAQHPLPLLRHDSNDHQPPRTRKTSRLSRQQQKAPIHIATNPSIHVLFFARA